MKGATDIGDIGNDVKKAPSKESSWRQSKNGKIHCFRVASFKATTAVSVAGEPDSFLLLLKSN